MANNIQYIYEDKNGKPLYRQIRYYKNEDKSFYIEKFVNGKWERGSDGVERVLYKLPLVIKAVKKAEKIYIVEGEKDVETLIEKGKTATTIAGGAGQKWQDSFTEQLKGSDIIILPDNDKPGKEFAIKVADSLVGNANTVRLLDLTKMWSGLKEKGDITDVFDMANNDEEVLNKLEELEKTTGFYMKPVKKQMYIPEEFEIKELNLKLKVPHGYSISTKKGIVKLKKVKGGMTEVLISPIPIVISKILINIETREEKVELLFYKRKKWQSLIVDKNTLCNAQSISNLANKGIPITSNLSKDMVDWFFKLEVENYNDISIERTTNKFGWVDDITFVPFRNNDIHLELEPGISTWIDKINEKKGSIEEWKENIKYFLQEDETGIIRFILAVGFSSCLLHIVNYRGTIFHIWGPSGIGKTALLEICNSIYAPPDNIITFAATPISITILSERLSRNRINNR